MLDEFLNGYFRTGKINPDPAKKYTKVLAIFPEHLLPIEPLLLLFFYSYLCNMLFLFAELGLRQLLKDSATTYTETFETCAKMRKMFAECQMELAVMRQATICRSLQ